MQINFISILYMEEELIESCMELHKNNVITNRQLENCKKNIGSEETLNYLDNKNQFEEEKFNENRSTKNKKIDDLLKNLDKLQTQYSNVSDEKKETLNEALKEMNRKIKDLMLNNFKNNENSNYEKFLDNYFEMNNSKNLNDKFNQNSLTLKQKLHILNHKLTHISLLGTIVFLIVNIIILIILLRLFYF